MLFTYLIESLLCIHLFPNYIKHVCKKSPKWNSKNPRIFIYESKFCIVIWRIMIWYSWITDYRVIKVTKQIFFKNLLLIHKCSQIKKFMLLNVSIFHSFYLSILFHIFICWAILSISYPSILIYSQGNDSFIGNQGNMDRSSDIKILSA